MRCHQIGEENSGWKSWFWHGRVRSWPTHTLCGSGNQFNAAVLLSVPIHTWTVSLTESPMEFAALWHIILGGTEHASHLFFCRRENPYAHIFGITPYFSACSKCPWGSTLFSCFMQSVIACWRSRGAKNRHATLETVSEIPGHLMKAFIFFGLHPSMLISFKCWNKWVCLVLIVNRSWAELDTGPKGTGTETQGPSDWENTKCSFRIITAWAKKA